MPVVASAAADVTIVELVRPTGKLLLVPATEPPPLVRPWHSLQLLTVVTFPWNESDLLQALPEVFASAAWQTKQSLPVTKLEPWFIHCAALVEVPPRGRVYVTLLWVEALAAGKETAWQTTHAVGCGATFAWKRPVCHKVAAIGVLAPFDSAVVWQVWQFWKVSWLAVCFIVKLTPLVTSDLAASTISG